MKLFKHVRILTLTFISLLALSCVTNNKDQAEQAKALVPDTRIISGKLDNGLSYFVQENDDPKGRVFIRLVVKAGSLDETDAESGAAHFLEHMAFNGTKSFPKNALVEYFESTGMKFGDALNAGTSFDSTEYELEVPSDNLMLMAMAFKIAREWADGIALDPQEVIKERGVILEEARSRLSAGDRVWKQQAPAVYGESLYRREIVGTPESISTMTAERLRGFYERFYRTDLMAVVVVGDAPAAELEKLIRYEFDSLVKRDGPALVSRDIGPLPGLRTSAVSDGELTKLNVELAARIVYKSSVTERDSIEKIKNNIATGLMGNRFSEAIRRSGGKTVSGMSVDLINLGGDDCAWSLSATTSGKAWADALDFAKTQLAQAAKYGFSAEEIERVKSEFAVGFEDAKKNGYQSESLAGKLINWFLYDTVPVSIDDKIRLYDKAFSGYTDEVVAGIAASILKPASGFFILSMPDATGVDLSEKTLADAVAKPTGKLEPWKEDKATGGLAGILPEAAAPASMVERKELGLLDFTYPNGMRVLLKKTDFEADEIYFNFKSWGGTDGLTDSEYANFLVAKGIMPASGFTGIPAQALQGILADKSISLSVSGSEMHTGMSGYSNRKDLETLFQLARRTMTDPVIDSGYLAMVTKQISEYGTTFANNPDRVFSAEISKAIYPLRPRLLMFTKPGDAAVLDAAIMKSVFASFFCPPKGGILVLAGSFEIEAARALCDKYFGTIPASPAALRPPVVAESKPVAGATKTVVKAGVESKAQAVFVYKTPISDTDELTVNGLDYLAGSLEKTLRERIREDKGGTYGVSAMAVTDPLRGFSQITISFETDPKRIEELAPIVGEEVAKLIQDGVPQALIDEIRLAAKRDLDVSSRKNGFWTSQLSYVALIGEDLDLLGSHASSHAKVTAEWTKNAAKRYLDPGNLAVFTLLPADKK